MTLSPVPVESFGGLNLLDDAGTVGWGGAIDLLNVDFDKRGLVRAREGYTKMTTAEGTNRYDRLFPFYSTSASYQIVAGASTRLEAINTSGGVVTSQTGTGGMLSATRFGTPSAEYVYIGNGSDTLWRYSGAAFAQPTATVNGVGARAMPKAAYLATESRDNRLVAAYTTATGGPNGVASSSSHVWFSDAGNAESWQTTSYEQLTPGDGDSIQGVAAFEDLVFVFKKRKFFVFYGTSTDQTGNPIFNYRPIDTGIGLAGNRGLAVAADGVYFISYDGIYRTTGGAPVKVSAPLDPLFPGGAGAGPFYQGGVIRNDTYTDSGLAVIGSRLYFTADVSTGSVDQVFVTDLGTDRWTMWQIPAGAMAAFRASDSSPERLAFAYASGLKHIARLDVPGTAGTDDGSAIASRYRSGFSDLGTADMKRIHSWRAVGSGTPTLKLSTDFGSLETGAALTLGTSPAVAEGFRRYAPRGRKFSYQLGGTSAWSVNSLTAMVAGKRDAGEYTT